jgi:uncharacterized membrane protein (UPF0127 family)
MTRFCLCIALLLLLVAVGCNRGGTDATSGLALVRVSLAGQEFELEVANAPATRQRGLMHRPAMPAHRGMIFVFPQEEVLGFYMKDTLIPLDIVFINSAQRVVAIKQMKPLDQTTTHSSVPARWAIELNQGTAQRIGLRIGDLVEVPAEARTGL